MNIDSPFFEILIELFFFRLCHITITHQCQLSIIRFVPKYSDQTLVNFSVSPAEEGTDKQDAFCERKSSHDFTWI